MARDDAKDTTPDTDTDAETVATDTTVGADPAPAVTDRRIDRRSFAVGAGAVAVLLLAFLAGLAIGDGHDRGGHRGGGERGEFRADRAPFADGGSRGERGGRFGGRGGHAGGPQRDLGRGHGGPGVVESASEDELTIAPLGGRIEELTVQLDDDTEVQRRGDDGARDVEDAEVGDLDEGDIVMVVGAPGDAEERSDEDAATSATVDARLIVILRDGDE